MSGFISGADRSQGTMFPAQLEDYVAQDNPVRVIDFFVDQLDLRELGFSAVDPKETGRPAYHPAVMLKIYVYGYLNRNEFAGAGLQYEADDQHTRRQAPNGGDRCLAFLLRARKPRRSNRLHRRVLTRPRPRAALRLLAATSLPWGQADSQARD